MKPLSVSECLCPKLICVTEDQRPEQPIEANSIFAVFRDSTDRTQFCGLATINDIIQHPDWIFADLTEHRPCHYIGPETDVGSALQIMERHNLEALAIFEHDRLLGATSRQRILEMLLQRERHLLKESRRLNTALDIEKRDIIVWSEKLTRLHEASRNLLTVLAHTTLQYDLIQKGIDALTELLEAKYGAISILDENGSQKSFLFSGMTEDQARKIGRFPQGKGLLGVVVQENISLIIDDMARDPRSEGFPAHHPPMKSLLAVPISYHNRIYGRIYLCDKEDGSRFSKIDEDLAFSFAHMLALMLENIHELEEIKRAHQNLEYVSSFDSLTGLPNKTLLRDRADQAISLAQRNGDRIAVLFLDLDNFKMVNDSFGHTLGDELLTTVTERIIGCLKDGDTLARFGGDEFVVLLPNICEIQDAANMAGKILWAMRPAFSVGSHDVFIGSSIGISIYPDNAKDIDRLLADADNAMYHAKKLGKNNYQFFTSDMNLLSQNFIKIESNLRQALKKNELTLYYQPKVELNSTRIIGFEALLRWFNPLTGYMPPDQFIPIAEETGLIHAITEWVLKTACSQAKTWQAEGSAVQVAVNLSSRQFAAKPGVTLEQHPLVQIVTEALADSGLPASLLELEITEGALMEHLDTTFAILDRFKTLGVGLSIDDFGTGYSSLSYLKRFPIDTLKIDKSFVNDIGTDANDRAIVAAITDMAHRLNLIVVAEGVENEEQLQYLRDLRCHQVQGYYFGKPMPGDQASALLLTPAS